MGNRWLTYFPSRILSRSNPHIEIYLKNSSMTYILKKNYGHFKKDQNSPPSLNLSMTVKEKEQTKEICGVAVANLPQVGSSTRDFSSQVGPPESPGALTSRPPLSSLIQEKVDNGEFFYGLEVSARPFASPLDYATFETLLPLFTSIVWLSEEYAEVEKLDNVASINLAEYLRLRTVVMPHVSCYNMSEDRLVEFLAHSFDSVLATRGVLVREEQRYKQTDELVQAVRSIRKDTITIGVGGYPEYHQGVKSAAEDLKYLHDKVNAGADFIITQVCFSSKKIIQFVRNCRAAGINKPIVIGLYIPSGLRGLEAMLKITGAHLPASSLEKYTSFRGKRKELREFAVDEACKMFKEVVDAKLDTYGVLFYTMNRFDTVKMFLDRLEKEHIFTNVLRK